MVPRENIRTQGKTKLTSFPRDPTLSALLYTYLDFSLKNHIAVTKKNKDDRTSLFTIVNPAE